MLSSPLRTTELERLAVGQIVIAHVDSRRNGRWANPRFRRFRVESFPGPDGRGLGHCANLAALDRVERHTVSAHWFEIIG